MSLAITRAQYWAGSGIVSGLFRLHIKDDAGATIVETMGWDGPNFAASTYGPVQPAMVTDVRVVGLGSDDMGGYQPSTVEVDVFDVSGRLQRRFGGTVKSLRGSPCQVVIAHKPTTVTLLQSQFVGVVDEVIGNGPDRYTIRCVDKMSQYLDREFPATSFPAAHFTPTYFDAPNFAGVIGQPEPIAFGTFGTGHPIYGGEWPGIYAGVAKTISGDPTWRMVVVARHRVTINSIWYKGPSDPASADVSSQVNAETIGIKAPGFTNWSLAEAANYVVKGGREYTVVYVSASVAQDLEAGNATISFGITADYLTPTSYGITSWDPDLLVAQMVGFLDNFVFASYEAGSPLDYTAAPSMRGADWTAVIAASLANGAWGLRERRKLRDILAELCVSADVLLGVDLANGWLNGACPGGSGAISAPGVTVSDAQDIAVGTFSAEKRTIHNIHPYAYRQDMFGSGYQTTGLDSRDSTSVTERGPLEAPPVNLLGLRDSSSVAWVMARRLARTKSDAFDPTFEIGGGSAWMESMTPLGSIIGVTHRGAPSGYRYFGDVVRSLAPTSFWRLSEGPQSDVVTTVAHDAVGSNPGQYSGVPAFGHRTFAIDEPSTGLRADQFDDVIFLSLGAIALGTTFSLMALIEPEPVAFTGAFHGLFGMAGGGLFYERASKKLTMSYSAAQHYNNTALTDRRSYLIGCSVAAGAGTFYIDGVSDGTFSSVPSGMDISFLLCGTTTANKWGGFVKDLAVWVGTALTANQWASLQAARRKNAAVRGWSNKAVHVRRMAWSLASKRLAVEARQWVQMP